MAEFFKTAIPKIEQAERGYCDDRFQPFTVKPIKGIALPEFRAIRAKCLEQAVLEMERCILDKVLNRPKTKNPEQWTEDRGKFLAILDRSIGSGCPAEAGPEKGLEERREKT